MGNYEEYTKVAEQVDKIEFPDFALYLLLDEKVRDWESELSKMTADMDNAGLLRAFGLQRAKELLDIIKLEVF